MTFRLALLVLIFATLSACNMAVSDHSMFSAEDQLITPLKDGLWIADDPDCAVDSTLAKEKWPKCVTWTIIRDNKFIDFSGDKEEDRPTGLLIAGGQPPIVQLEMIEKGKRIYLFMAIEPTGSDAAGAVTALHLWVVACGTEKTPGSSQVDPYPGFDKECRPQTTDALRAAAVASRPKTGEPERMKWVRAGAR